MEIERMVDYSPPTVEVIGTLEGLTKVVQKGPQGPPDAHGHIRIIRS